MNIHFKTFFTFVFVAWIQSESYAVDLPFEIHTLVSMDADGGVQVADMDNDGDLDLVSFYLKPNNVINAI